ncbi:MAG: hypothetical protein OEQ39_21945 [Gammaproteobacteria bacterium]|nr:hypothetical protein [Gammaproteobacteria bacterium]MDH3468600.1 hypothetical protein [Gammaproteobacteria bacterium]
MEIFPYGNIVAGILVLIVGFGFHWIGQGISLINWDFATRIGLQESGAPHQYKIYEHGIAMADTALGWLYFFAGLGLILDEPWGYKLAWIPGSILIYHAISFWGWTRNQILDGVRLSTTLPAFRYIWISANLTTGLLAIAIAWNH